MTSPGDVAASLPSPAELRSWLLARFVVDVCSAAPSRWGRSETFELRPGGWEVYRSSNGSGDEVSVTFAPEGVLVRSFDHESPVSPFARRPRSLHPGLADGFPEPLLPVLSDPAFDSGLSEGYIGVPCATMLLWRTPSDPSWRHGSPAPYEGDAGAHLLGGLVPATGLLEELEDLSEHVPPLWALEHVYAGHPLTGAVVSAISPGRRLADVLLETAPAGYPTA